MPRPSPARLGNALLSLAIGLGVGFLMGFNSPPAVWRIETVYGGLVGLGIFAVSFVGTRLAARPLAALSPGARRAAHAVLYLLSGVVAWTLAGLALSAVL